MRHSHWARLNLIARSLSVSLCQTTTTTTMCSSASKPDFCGSYDCPHFTRESKTDGYEVRRYEGIKWVTTTNTTGGAFNRLFGYISGANATKQKLDMTVPVINRMEPNKDEMSFFIPPVHQADPPTPTGDDVRISNMEGNIVYVRSFGGYMNPEALEDNMVKLKDALDKDGLGDAYHKNFYYTAGYNAPWKFWNRHNEIWLFGK